jgi:hypothetical protein
MTDIDFLPKDILIHLTRFLDCESFKNLIITCKKYYSYKGVLHNNYEFSYSNIENIAIGNVDQQSLIDKFCKFEHLGNTQFKDEDTLKLKTTIDHGNISSILSKNKKINSKNNKNITYIIYSIYREVLDSIMISNNMGLSTTKYIIFKSVHNNILIIENISGAWNVECMKYEPVYILTIDLFGIWTYRRKPQEPIDLKILTDSESSESSIMKILKIFGISLGLVGLSYLVLRKIRDSFEDSEN